MSSHHTQSINAPAPSPWAGLGHRSEWSTREFTPAEKSLIKRVHGFMSPRALLGTLNERLVGDLGDESNLYTMDQLLKEIGGLQGAEANNGPKDWASIRKVLTAARREGLLAQITEQTINDFAVVYSLNSKQVMVLKDMVLTSAKG